MKNPQSDSTLYYLYACYKKLNKLEEQIDILEKLAKRGSNDERIYMNLVYYYQQSSRFNDLFNLLMNLATPIMDSIDSHFVLTRRRFAEMIYGAIRRTTDTDPMVYVISKDYLPIFPDGKLYDNDTLTLGNLIILLDRLLEPIYPRRLFSLKNVSVNSYLYLPYMRVIDFGILEFDPDLNPNHYASISSAVTAISNLKKRGIID